jgi:hypothetical protein
MHLTQRASVIRGWPLWLAVCFTVAGCYSQVPPPRSAKLRVLAEPATTTVYVDDLYVGSARVLAARPKVLDPGIKHVTFKAPQHFPHDVQVDLPPGTTTIKMKLRPIPK